MSRIGKTLFLGTTYLLSKDVMNREILSFLLVDIEAGNLAFPVALMEDLFDHRACSNSFKAATGT